MNMRCLILIGFAFLASSGCGLVRHPDAVPGVPDARKVINLGADGPSIDGLVQRPERIAVLAHEASKGGQYGHYCVVAVPDLPFRQFVMLWELLTQNGQQSVSFQSVGEPSDFVVSVPRPEFHQWVSVVKVFPNGRVSYEDSPKDLASVGGRADLTKKQNEDSISPSEFRDRLLLREHLADSVVYIDPTECGTLGQFTVLLQAIEHAGIKEVFWITFDL